MHPEFWRGNFWKTQQTEVTTLRWISKRCSLNVEGKDMIGSGVCLMVDCRVSSVEPSSSGAKDCYSEGVL
jgi:hypothetical protein